ncbi:hypothetical protein QEZ54_13615 [Catellatospora sp. KI3]|uniref:hypothetical protein n=1 Tax=Catellatospora sp. KI3 TaxID=3041620 RepID=UPI0024821C06|nr:hypothetical protein [Catellatospora sp. KI3]MDI1462007.1 hypothetical protein [Catellatospora sp. KI3]
MRPPTRRARTLALSAALLAVVLSGCGLLPVPAPVPDHPLRPLPGAPLSAPVDTMLAQPAWLPDGWIYYLSDPDDMERVGHLHRTRYWRSRPGAEPQQLTLPDLAGCRLTRYDQFDRLPDGRLGAQRQCLTEDVHDDWYDQVAIDPETMRVDKLARTGRWPLNSITWAPSLDHGYAAYYDEFCPGLLRVIPAGTARFPDPVDFDGVAWPISETYFDESEAACKRNGSTRQPQLLADGVTLLLLASPGAAGRQGSARENQRWFLYRWQPGAGAPVRVAGPFGRGLDPVVSYAATPDGRYAVVCDSNGVADRFLRVDLHSGETVLLAEGHGNQMSVSPDGRQVVVAAYPYLGSAREPVLASIYRMELRLIDLGLAS